MEVADTPASTSATGTKPRLKSADRDGLKQLRVKKKDLQAMLEQCQRTLELLKDADLNALGLEGPEEDNDDEGESKDGGGGSGSSPRSSVSSVTDESEADELCKLLKSRVDSPEFLEHLGSIHVSVSHNLSDENPSWDMVTATDLWENEGLDGESTLEDFVLVKREDIVDGIACFMAAYLLSLEQTKDLTPTRLQEALSKTFSVKKKKGKLRKAWDGSRVVYNVASWGATAVGIYQNPALLNAASTAFWASCRAISKLL